VEAAGVELFHILWFLPPCVVHRKVVPTLQKFALSIKGFYTRSAGFAGASFIFDIRQRMQLSAHTTSRDCKLSLHYPEVCAGGGGPVEGA